MCYIRIIYKQPLLQQIILTTKPNYYTEEWLHWTQQIDFVTAVNDDNIDEPNQCYKDFMYVS